MFHYFFCGKVILKKTIVILCLLLVGCSKVSFLKQLKKEVIHESDLLYVECNSNQQEQILPLQQFSTQQIIVLDSLLETDDSLIIFIETKETSNQQLFNYLHQFDPSATLLSQDNIIVFVRGADKEIVEKKFNEMIKG